MADTVASTLQATQFLPSLTVDDLPKSVTFYEGLGFAVEERWEEGGQLVGVMLKAGDVRLGLSQDDWKKGRDRKKGIGLRIYININDDVDQLAARAKASGLTLDSDPQDSPWGSRVFEVTDPTGFKLTIGKERQPGA